MSRCTLWTSITIVGLLGEWTTCKSPSIPGIREHVVCALLSRIGIRLPYVVRRLVGAGNTARRRLTRKPPGQSRNLRFSQRGSRMAAYDL